MSPLAAAVLAGDRRAAGRLITRAEAGDAEIEADLRALYRHGGKARIIGVTGPPGAGKSTFVDRMIEHFRKQARRVAVLAVDPSSPLTGGAVLGDRVRMYRHAEDTGVLIRSMAARGALGGLSHATGDALTVLDAMGFDEIVIETVGVGQSEIDILSLADVTLLLQTAHGGDGIQSVKAGVLEIADIIVVNKADAPGTDKMIRALAEMVAHRTPTAAGWDTPVLAAEATAGTGVEKVLAEIDGFFGCRAAHTEATQERARARMRARVLVLAQAALKQRLQGAAEPAVVAAIDRAIARESDPHTAAALLFPAARHGRA
jgi:LAO/AO transport system kinase